MKKADLSLRRLRPNVGSQTELFGELTEIVERQKKSINSVPRRSCSYYRLSECQEFENCNFEGSQLWCGLPDPERFQTFPSDLVPAFCTRTSCDGHSGLAGGFLHKQTLVSLRRLCLPVKQAPTLPPTRRATEGGRQPEIGTCDS